MLREPEFLVIKELGVEPEALVSEPEALTGVMGWSQRLWCMSQRLWCMSQRLWCKSQRLWYSCDYCVTPSPLTRIWTFGLWTWA